MSAIIRILSTKTIDSSPSILLVSPDGSKTLINCGEGCQRIFLEFSQKASTITRICLTHLSYETIGGLPGMILTTADISAAIIKDVANKAKTAVANAAPTAVTESASSATSSTIMGGDNETTIKRDNRKNNHKSKSKNNTNNDVDTNLPGLDIIGPHGTQQFLSSLKHFMRRDAYQLHVHEGKYMDNSGNNNNNSGTKSKKRKRNIQNNNNNGGGDNAKSQQEYFNIETIVCDVNNNDQDDSNDNMMKLDDPNDGKRHINKQYLSYVFTTPPIQGKFMANRAKELGIPPGPLYGKLKSGQSITFVDKLGKEIIVESHQVVEPGTPGVSTAILYYPTEDLLDQLIKSDQLCQLKPNSSNNNNDDKAILEVIIHIAPSNLFSTCKCNEWRKSFGVNIQHMFVNTSDRGSDCSKDDDADDELSGMMTPFLSARAGAFARSQLSIDIFGLLSPMVDREQNNNDDDDDKLEETAMTKVDNDDNHHNYTAAQPLLEYVIVPRSKKGFQNQSFFIDSWFKVKAELEELVRTSGADVHAKHIESTNSNNLSGCGEDTQQRKGELIFTGTGSAVPCKHRNVSGIFLRMKNGSSMLLDVGEGTIGQLLGMRHNENRRDVFTEIKAVWISHPHADHHLGIIRLLEERANHTNEKITLVAPTNLYYFLRDFENIDPSIINSYNFINCRDLVNPPGGGGAKMPANFMENWNKMKIDLGITSCRAVPVQHCPNAFAVILDGTPFGSLAYSGDCRPSSRLAAAAMNIDVLIHEATFADGMEKEANVKKHCTVGEALNVGRQMKAKNVILTHFSQRYPKIPPISSTTDVDGTDLPIPFPVVFAFDFARLSPTSLVAASKLTPALRLLYPEDEKSSDGCSEEEDRVIDAALQEPGLFAQSSLL